MENTVNSLIGEIDIYKALDVATKLLECVSAKIEEMRDEYQDKVDNAKRVTEEMEEKLDYINEAADEIDSVLDSLSTVESDLEEFEA